MNGEEGGLHADPGRCRGAFPGRYQAVDSAAMDRGSAPPYEEHLGDGLVLHVVRDERDAERFIALNAAVTGEGTICDRLLHGHPETCYEDYVVVEDGRTGEVVSTTCLIPWQCCYEGVVLDVAMLEMVVTHPDYRRRGLVRAQVRRFHRMAVARGFDLCIIQGIPYYYRQYGYAYALDHAPYDALPTSYLPDRPVGGGRYQLRLAMVEDAEVLTVLYGEVMAGHSLHVLRSADYWRYLIERARWPVQLVENEGRAVGYVCAYPQAEGRCIRVDECGVAGHEAAMAVLRQLETEGAEEIRLASPAASALVQAARTLGSTSLRADQWLVRIPDCAAFLLKIGPILEHRLAHSVCAGLTADLFLNQYRSALVFHFQDGRLRRVEDIGFVDASIGADGGDLCIPPDALVRLVLGYRSLDELTDAWPDTAAKPGSRHVWEALFPRMVSYVHMPY